MPKNEKNYRNNLQDERLDNVEKHIEKINDELGSVKEDMAKIRTDVKWLRQSYWVIFTASVGALIATLFNLIQ